MKRDRQVESIRQAYPELTITSVAFGDGGQNNDVVVVNEEWIFRFPRYLEALERLEVETAILQGIEAYVSLEVPAPVYVALEGQEIGEAFMGYRRLPGEPFRRETFRAIEDERTELQLAGQLGGFLRELHGVPVAEAIDPALRAMGAALPRADTYEECADIYERMQWKLFPQMRPDARRWVAEHFEQFLGDGASFEYEPMLKHGDFGPSNILYDAQAGWVRGIIDFGSSCLGDPAYDFAGLLSGYGVGFVERCAKAYPEVEGYLARVRFYQGTFALLEALFGVEHGDEAAYRAGMVQYV